MNQLGAKFKNKREELNISLAKARDETNIRLSYLKAIEEGRFEDVEQEVYLKGFLKIYAKYLGLDERKILKRYQDNKKEEDKKEEKEDLTETDSNKTFGEKVKDFMDTHQNKLLYSFMITLLIIVIVTVLFLGVMVYNSFISSSGELNLFSNVGNYINEIGIEESNQKKIESNEALEVSNKKNESKNKEESSKQNRAESRSKDKKSSLTETEKRVDNKQTKEETKINLTIEAIGDSWAVIKVDGESVFRGTIKQGDKKSFSGQKITLQISNAAGIKIIKDGEEFGPFGKVGEVVVKEYSINSN